MKLDLVEQEMLAILTRADEPERARELRRLFVALPADDAHALVRRFFGRLRR